MTTMTKKKATAQKYQHHVDQLAWVEPRNLIHAWVDLPGHPSDRDYWECFRFVFVGIENIQKSFWSMMMGSPRPGKDKWLMNNEDRAFLASLPDEVTVYRGCSVNKANGLSWTTDPELARWFANRFNFKSDHFGKDCCIVTGTLRKADIFAVILERDEITLICDPSKVKGRTKEILPPKKG
jgi:hypothetical protein